ncbi:MAG TPA: hypothetical protein VN364_00480 [Bellilinea sp.]|nr:hypothetical protein [Bellilinea sp.]
MTENQENNDASVDRREETSITHLPGYTATEQVVLDVAAERRLELFQVYRILGTLLVFLEILLAIRFLLRVISANPDSGFAVLIYGITGILVAPFNGLVSIPILGGITLEVTTLIAMAMYALLFWGIAVVIKLVAYRPTSRKFTRTIREQTPGAEGNVRIKRTTISGRKK